MISKSLSPMNLFIYGASARAAAYSTRRANLIPWAADLFGDEDTKQCCAGFRKIDKLALHRCTAAHGVPAGPWIYTGGLENRPELVAAISRMRRLWGNSPEVLRKVRSPAMVRQVLQRRGISCPDVCDEPPTSLSSRRWLMKARAGSGGLGISYWTGTLPHGSQLARFYFQAFIEGEACAALFCAAGGDARLLGATKQLVGESTLHARPFQYCGSIGPLPLSPRLEKALVQLGKTLAAAFELRGLFGVDYITRDDLPWPVEINPRYTASVEVLELAHQWSLLDLHRHACESAGLTWSQAPDASRVIAKGIYFAPADLVFPRRGPWIDCLQRPWSSWTVPDYADIPRAGLAIDKHHPVLTFMIQGRSLNDCLEEMRRRATYLDQCMGAS
jgi:predicted ATP-grasp superfamily ATP-dependent carboligase